MGVRWFNWPMKTLFGVCAVLLGTVAANAAVSFEETLKNQYQQVNHWGGEVTGEDSKERIEEINTGAKKDCSTARKSVDKALGMKKRSAIASAYVIQIVNTCNLVWADKTDWKAKLSPLCKSTQSHFKTFSSENNPDGQSAYLSLCPEQAAKIYK